VGRNFLSKVKAGVKRRSSRDGVVKSDQGKDNRTATGRPDYQATPQRDGAVQLGLSTAKSIFERSRSGGPHLENGRSATQPRAAQKLVG